MDGLFELLENSSKKYPGRTFIKSGGADWSYSQVYSMSMGIAGHLQRCGVRKGDRVVVFCENSIQYVIAFFGIIRLNAVAVPVNPARMSESIGFIINKCSPRLIAANNSTIEKLNKLNDKPDVRILNIDACDISVDCPENALDTDRDDAAMILFTSGTTAYPKGVTLTHGNLLSNTEAIIEYLRLTPEDSILMTLPFTYSYGNSILLTHASVGAALVLENSSAYPYKVLEGIKNHEVTGYSTVGSYINLMLGCIRNSGTDTDTGTKPDHDFFEKLRYITFAGESVNYEDVVFINRKYPHISIYVMYGQTEASARLSYLSPGLIYDRPGSIGKGLCNVELRVTDEEGNPVKPGQLGEITAFGPNIMKGYWEDPAATEEVLRDGWLHTGDIATVDEDGFIYIKGRKTDMIKFMGHRISPVEIENVINGGTLVKESAVIEDVWEGARIIKAFVVLEKEYPLEYPLDELVKYVNSRLPIYMRPHIFQAVEALPRTESGKIRRSMLRSAECAG